MGSKQTIMEDSVTSNTNHSLGNVGEDSFHSVLYAGGEMVANVSGAEVQSCYSAPLFESMHSGISDKDNHSKDNNESESGNIVLNNERNRVESNSEYNLTESGNIVLNR